MFEINLELRRRLEEEHNEYRKKLQSFQESQQKQGQLVQRLQKKVRLCGFLYGVELVEFSCGKDIAISNDDLLMDALDY